MKKIICITLALFFIASVFILPVYADDDSAFTDGVENAVRAAAIVEKYKQYKNGECTEDEFKTYAAQKTGKAYYDGTVDRTLLVTMLTDCGVDVDGYVNKWLSDDNGYPEFVDSGGYYFEGYNPVLESNIRYDVVFNTSSPKIYVQSDGLSFIVPAEYISNYTVTYISSDGETITENNQTSSFGMALGTRYINNYYMTGTNCYDFFDWGDTPIPEGFGEVAPTDIDDMTEEQLDDFIDYLNSEFAKLIIDLNSMLSVLQAILNQTASINSKMVTSGQFNSGIQQIISAINSINSDKVLTEEEQQQQLQQQIDEQEKIDTEIFVPKTKIDKKLLDLKNLWLSKFSFISEFKDCFELIKYSDEDNVSIDIDLYGQSASVDLSFFDNIIGVFRVMLAAFIYFSYGVRQFKRMPVIIGGGGDEL